MFFPKEKFTRLILHTVDGRNPAPVDMVDISVFIGFYISQRVQDFFDQPHQGGTLSTDGHLFSSTLPATSLKPQPPWENCNKGHTREVEVVCFFLCLGSPAHLMHNMMFSGCFGIRVLDEQKTHLSLLFVWFESSIPKIVYKRTLWVGDVFLWNISEKYEDLIFFRLNVCQQLQPSKPRSLIAGWTDLGC